MSKNDPKLIVEGGGGEVGMKMSWMENNRGWGGGGGTIIRDSRVYVKKQNIHNRP